MSAPTPHKPLSTTSNASPRRGVNDVSPGRPSASVSSVPAGMASGIGRTPSFRQARPARRSAARMSTSLADDDVDDEDHKRANAELTAEIGRIRQERDQARHDQAVVRARLEQATSDQTALEERDLQKQTEIDRLRAEVKDLARQVRETDNGHESDKQLLVQDNQKLTRVAGDLQSKNERLHEMLRNNGLEKTYAHRMSMPPDPRPPNGHSQEAHDQKLKEKDTALREKDAVIETLQFQLAEFQFNQTQAAHSGEGRAQSLEKDLLELRMEKARLQEENESFQVLLSDKTLKGDFMPDFHDSAGLNTLAEELESIEDDLEPQSEAFKKLEVEYKKLAESNKALTLYIDKIVGRILQHDGFEHIIKDRDDAPPPPPSKSGAIPIPEKALPPPPGQEGATPPTASAMANAASGFLQRAKSVVSRPGRPSRPMSYAQPSQPPQLSANENPQTAPSIPLNRGHRRARSDQAQQDLGAAAVVQQMNRGSPLRTASGGPMSPGISPMNSQLAGKAGYFPALSQASTRAPSASQQVNGRGSSRNSVTSDHSQEHSSTDASSAQASAAAPSVGPNIPGAVMKQNQLRPLRLVQAQNQEDEDARKRANRGSWMGWLKGSSIEAQNDETTR